MTVISKLVNGRMEVFECNGYKIGMTSEFHPLLVSVDIYSNGVKVAHRGRPLAFIYKHITFKTKRVRDRLKEIEEMEIREAAKREALQGNTVSGVATEGAANERK